MNQQSQDPVRELLRALAPSMVWHRRWRASFTRWLRRRGLIPGVIVPSFNGIPMKTFQSPSHALVPVTEKRPETWVAHLEMWGLFGYGDTEEAAIDRVLQMLDLKARATNHRVPEQQSRSA